MLYRAVRPFLFALDPETAHSLTLKSLDCLERLGVASIAGGPTTLLPVRVMGLDFPNPVGLAAGLDKDGEHIDGLFALGFGFIEVGAVTPRPQAGNPAPRLFRLPEAEALINRLGFNSRGVDAFVENIRRSRHRGIVGVNIDGRLRPQAFEGPSLAQAMRAIPAKGNMRFNLLSFLRR